MIAPVHLLAFVALAPAAVDPSLLLRADVLVANLCGGGSVSIPLGNPLPGSNGAVCCAKGCHAGEARRKAGDRIAR